MRAATIPVSYGELVDRLTILEIKSERIEDPDKLVNVRRELDLLLPAWNEVAGQADEVDSLRIRIKAVNEKLWDIEDRIRAKERAGSFDDEFVDLARSVYRTNDDRARLCNAINAALGSTLIDEKSYQDYGTVSSKT